MNLGESSISLAVKDVQEALRFYEALGFNVIDGGDRSKDFPDSEAMAWRVLQSGHTKIGLFQGMFDQNIITFHPKDLDQIHRRLQEAEIQPLTESEPGQEQTSLMLADPDGNLLLFDRT